MHLFNTIQTTLAVVSALYFVINLIAPRRKSVKADSTWSDDRIGFRS